MARPNWEYIRVDVLLPSNPKLSSVQVASRWCLIECWCYCAQHLTDGFIPDAIWRRIARPRVRQPLIDNGLAVVVPGGVQMHDYLAYQRSRADAEELSAKRAEAGRRGGKAKARAVANAKQEPPLAGASKPSKSVAEAEAEAEADKSSMAEPHDHLSGGNLPHDDVIDSVISEIHEVTGRIIKPDWARAIASSLLTGREPDDPAAYVRAAIRNERDPRTRFLPVASSHPSARTATEAAFAAGIQPGQRPAGDQAIASIAAQARQALNRRPA